MEFLLLFWKYLLKPVLSRYRRNIFLSCCAVFFIFWMGSSKGFFRLPFSTVTAFEAISESAAVILECNNIENRYGEGKNADYYDGLLNISLINKWEKGITFIDSLFYSTLNFSDIPAQARLVSAAQVVSNNHADWIYILEDYDTEFIIDSFLAQLRPHKTIQSTYRGLTIFHLIFSDNQKMTLAYYKGLILLSHEKFLLESAIETLVDIRGNVHWNESFRRVAEKSSSGSEVAVLVNFKMLPSLTSVVSKIKPPLLSSLGSFGDWTSLDARFLESGFMLSGHFYPDSKNTFLKELSHQKAPENSEIAQYLPKNLAVFLYLGWEDFAGLYHAYKEVEFKDFEQFFLPWVGREVALLLKDPIDDENNFANDRLLFVHSKDTVLSRRLLSQFADQYGELTHKTFQNFEIIQIAAFNTFRPLFGEEINPVQNPFYTIVDEYVVFSNSLSSLEGWIKNHNAGQHILQLPEFQSFFKQAQNQSNIYALLNTPYSMKFFRHFLRPELHEYIKAPFAEFRNIYPVGVQFFGLDDHFLLSLSAAYNKVEEVESNATTIAWEAELKGEAAIAPQVLRSHDGNFYIMIQDTLNRLYLFDKNGVNLWPEDRLLPHRISSKVFEVDFYGNDEIQYAFSTAYHIYVIDREGLEVKRIPLISKAANAVLVKDLGYGPRFFIACINGFVYAYDQNGKPLSGWQPLSGVGPVGFPFDYMNYNKERYFVMTSGAGACQAYNLSADPHFKGGKLLSPISGWGVDATIGRIAAGSYDGEIKILNSLGKGFSLKALKGMTSDVHFVYSDVVGDERKDYIRVSDSLMFVHYYNKEKNKKGRIKDIIKNTGRCSLNTANIDKAFEIKLQGYAKNFIGTLDLQNGSISLYDAKGQIQKGFPLAGTSKFQVIDLFKENSNTLVVANKNTIYTCKLMIK